MKNCLNCGSELEDNETVCPNCGFAQQGENPQEKLSEKNAKISEKSAKKHSQIYQNFCFYMSFPRMPIIFLLISAVCAVAIWFFFRQKTVEAANPSLVSSCNIMIVVFSIFLLLSIILTVCGLVLSIKKAFKKRKIKN